MTQELMT